jgi:hypothetical protein
VNRWLEWSRIYRLEADNRPAGVPIVGRLERARDFLPWYWSQSASPAEQGKPWITFEATRLLDRRLRKAARVFEYGSGGSTVFFGRRGAEVVSVEHDRDWHARIREATAALPRVEVVLAEPRVPRDDEEAAFSSTSEEFVGQTFIEYVTVVDRYPDHHFDVLVVDGRARPSCFFRAEPKVRVGGLVVLDDSERPRYGRVVEAATSAGWLEAGRYGPKPFNRHFGRTSVWTKTRDLDSAINAR